MSTRNPEIRLSAPLALLAPPPGKPLPAQFAGIAYTGGLVPSHGAVIDLASTTVPKSMALLAEHQREQIIGKVDDAGVRNNQIAVAGALYSDMIGTPAERIAQLAQRGTAFQLSIGLFNFSEEYVPAGITATVNGKSFAGPVTVMRNGVVRECSVVTLGADPHTSVELFSMPNSRDRQIRELFAEVGETIPQHERAMLHGLTDVQFRLFADRLRELAVRTKREARDAATLNRIFEKRRERDRPKPSPVQNVDSRHKSARGSLSPKDVYARRAALSQS